MSLLELTVLALATWRCTALLSYERGPGDVFVRARGRLGIQPDADGAPAAWPERLPASAVVCVWCLSVYLGAAWALLWLLRPAPAFWLALPLALSAAAILVERYAHG